MNGNEIGNEKENENETENEIENKNKNEIPPVEPSADDIGETEEERTVNENEPQSSGRIYLDPLAAKNNISDEISADPVFKKNSDRAEKILSEHKEKMEKQKNKLVFFILIGVAVMLLILSVVFLFINRKTQETDSDRQKTQGVSSYEFSSVFGDTLKSKQVQYPEGLQDKFKAVYAQCQDFYGWIRVPNTGIDLPVYQYTDNELYLKHDSFGKYSKFGVTFADADSLEDLGSRNTVLYSHNFDDGLFFCDLHKYMDIDFYKQNPVIYFSSREHDYKFKVIGCFVSNGDTSGDNDYLFYYIATEMSDECVLDFVDEVEQRSFIKTGVDVQGTDKLLTLSTCTYYFDRNGSLENARLAVVARLVRDGESESVDTSKAVKNDNVRMPQLYYDVFGGTNPYVNASKWYPYG